MKKFFILIVFSFTVVTNLFADNIRIISQSDNSITVQRTYTATETAQYQRVDGNTSSRFSNFYQPGNVGLALHLGFGNAAFGHTRGVVEPEIGGQLYYNFPAKEKVKFGIAAGFDYGCVNWRFDQKQYWNLRAGIIICKYLGIGYVGGQYFGETKWNNGVYGTIYLPFCEWFGLNLDAKYVWGQGCTLGGGIIIQMNTKTTK